MPGSHTAMTAQPSPTPPPANETGPLSAGSIALLAGAFVLVIIVISRTLNSLFKDNRPR